MGDLLSALPAIIDTDGARRGVECVLNSSNYIIQCPKKGFCVQSGHIFDIANMGFRYDERMAWSRGVDVEECKCLFILVDFMSVDFPADYLTEYAISGHKQKIGFEK